MKSVVGIRELKQNASAIVRRAAEGEVIEVTDRGRPVARIVGIQHANPFDQLVAEGRVIPGRGRVLEHQPLPAPPGRPSGTEALAALRADER